MTTSSWFVLVRDLKCEKNVVTKKKLEIMGMLVSFLRLPERMILRKGSLIVIPFAASAAKSSTLVITIVPDAEIKGLDKNSFLMYIRCTEREEQDEQEPDSGCDRGRWTLGRPGLVDQAGKHLCDGSLSRCGNGGWIMFNVREKKSRFFWSVLMITFLSAKSSSSTLRKALKVGKF